MICYSSHTYVFDKHKIKLSNQSLCHPIKPCKICMIIVTWLHCQVYRFICTETAPQHYKSVTPLSC